MPTPSPQSDPPETTGSPEPDCPLLLVTGPEARSPESSGSLSSSPDAEMTLEPPASSNSTSVASCDINSTRHSSCQSAVSQSQQQQQHCRHHRIVSNHRPAKHLNQGENAFSSPTTGSSAGITATGAAASHPPPPPLSNNVQQQKATSNVHHHHLHSLSGNESVTAGSTGPAAAAAAASFLSSDPLNEATGVLRVGGVCSGQQQLTGSSSTTTNSTIQCRSRTTQDQTTRRENSEGATGTILTSDSPSPDVVLLLSSSNSPTASSSSQQQEKLQQQQLSHTRITTTTTTNVNCSTTATTTATAGTGGEDSRPDRLIGRLRRFLTTLHQFTCDISPEVGEKVHALILELVNCKITIEDFHQKIQEITQYPLRPYVVPFLRLHLPVVQNEIMLFARLSKLTPSQYLVQNESLILDPPFGQNTSSRLTLPSNPRPVSAHSPALNEAFEIFQPASTGTTNPVNSLVGSSSPTQRCINNDIRIRHPASLAMGIKELSNQMTSKRRYTPESRKENGLEEDAQTHDVPAKRLNTSSLSPNLPVSRSHHLSSGSTGPLHPLHSNATLTSSSLNASSSSSPHPTQMTSRSVLLEQAHEAAAVAAAAAAGIFRVTNGSSPAASNGHVTRESLSTNRSPAGPSDHHLMQMGERFDRDRVLFEKEYLLRNGKYLLSSYPDVVRSYSEELTRESEEEWRNIHTMLNCILGMVDKTKRALAILQQRTMENAANIWTPSSRNTLSSASRIIPGPATPASAASNSFSSHTPNHISIPVPPPAVVHQQQQQQQSLTHKSASQSSNTISPPTVIKQITRNDIMSTSLHPQTFVEQIIPTQESSRHSSRPVVLPVTQTRDVVSETMKRQAVAELQKAVSAAESKANELVANERAKMERLISEARRQAAEEAILSIHRQDDSSESCWNCGRKAAETCSGCNVARYCGSFCQHKDWETHHRVCGQGINSSASSNLNNSADSPIHTSGSPGNTSSQPACNPVTVASVVAAAAAAVASGGNNSSNSSNGSNNSLSPESRGSQRMKGSASPSAVNNSSRHPVKI